MGEVKFSKDEKERIVQLVKAYFTSELDQDSGGFEAEFLIDFFAEKIGPRFYNQGLSDAHLLFTEKTEEWGYLIQEMEKPVA